MSLKIVIHFIFILISLSVYSQTNIWNGSTDNDWHNGCNWSLGTIPTSSHIVTVPPTAVYPVITGNAHCNIINITSTAVNAVTINSGSGANLCISSTNAGTCSTILTDNTSGGTPAVNTTDNSDLCYDDSRPLTGTPGGGTFSIIVGNGSIFANAYSPNVGDAGNSVTIRYTVTGGCGGPTSDDVTFSVLPPFAIACAAASPASCGGGFSTCSYVGACGSGGSDICYSWTNSTAGTMTLNFPFGGGYISGGTTIPPGATRSVCKDASFSPFCMVANSIGDITWSSTSGESGNVMVEWN